MERAKVGYSSFVLEGGSYAAKNGSYCFVSVKRAIIFIKQPV